MLDRILDTIDEKLSWVDLDKLKKYLPKEGTIGFRLLQILAVILIIIAIICYCIFRLIQTAIWFIIAIVDLVLFLPLCLWWIVSGNFYGMRMTSYIGEKFEIFKYDNE